MKVVDIIKSVRWCIDEEAVNATGFADASAYDFGGSTTDNGLMNNVIKDKIGAAIRWACLNAHSSQLSVGAVLGAVEVVKEETTQSPTNNALSLGGQFLRLIRVKAANWHKAIMSESLIAEDSEEYVQLRNTDGAEATLERPQAALINTKIKKVEVWPLQNAGDVTITYVESPDLSSITDTTEINIPPAIETSFIYYLAYLLLSAYGDMRAERMIEIAKQNVGAGE